MTLPPALLESWSRFPDPPEIPDDAYSRDRTARFAAMDEPARYERAVLGALILDPRLRLLCDRLAPEHFASAYRGVVFKVILTTKHLDLVTLSSEMERRGIQPPTGHRWPVILAGLLDEFLVDEHNLGHYVAHIRTMALERKAARRAA